MERNPPTPVDIAGQRASTTAMSRNRPPVGGTLIVASLLILAIAFAGVWISEYVRPSSNSYPWEILPWFALAAGAIVLIGLVATIIQRWGESRSDRRSPQ